jgi:hypothetical protein
MDTLCSGGVKKPSHTSNKYQRDPTDPEEKKKGKNKEPSRARGMREG